MLHNFIRFQFPKRGLVTWHRPNRRWRGEMWVSLIALILCFFPSLLSSELVLFFTEPKLNASFQRRRLRKSREWARYDSYSDHLFSIGEWPLKMPQQEVFSLLSTLAESFSVVQQPTSNHFQCNFEFKANCRSDPIRNPILSEQSYPGFVNGPEIGVILI